jgi:hypothetical protein
MKFLDANFAARFWRKARIGKKVQIHADEL